MRIGNYFDIEYASIVENFYLEYFRKERVRQSIVKETR